MSTLGRVTLETRSMRRVRLSAGMTRWVVYLVALVGVSATVRFAIFPPRPARAGAVPAPPVDRASEAYAVLFVRQYLSWDAGRPDQHTRLLASFVGPGLDPEAGFRAPLRGSEAVLWAATVQERPGPQHDRVYTVAAQTDRQGLVYLAVAVGRTADGRLRLMGYPAFVGAPLTAPADPGPEQRLPDVADPQLTAVVTRALRNYLAGSTTNLSADLTPGARVSSPTRALAMLDLAQLKWTAGDRSVLATVHARDADGSEYTLRYELDVTQLANRWEIAAVQTDPVS